MTPERVSETSSHDNMCLCHALNQKRPERYEEVHVSTGRSIIASGKLHSSLPKITSLLSYEL